MQTKLFLKIWLLFVNFEKFTSINQDRDQSQIPKNSTVIGCGPRLIEAKKFSKVMNNKQISMGITLFAFITISVICQPKIIID